MEHMLLAVLVSAGSLGLLLAMGLLTDNLLGDQAERWARRVRSDDDERRSETTRPRRRTAGD
jgi:hypothetical protein